MKNKNIRLMAMVLMSISTFSFSETNSLSEIMLPLIVKHDSAFGDRLLPLEMAFRLRGREYRLPLDRFLSQASSDTEQRLTRLIEYSRQGDMNECLALLNPGKTDIMMEQKDQLKKNVENIVRLYSQIFSKPENVVVFYQIFYETKRVFILGQPGTQNYFYILFSESPEHNYYWDLSDNESINALIVFSVMHRDNTVLKDKSETYSYEIPLTDSAYEDVVNLCFNGQIYQEDGLPQFNEPSSAAASMILLRTIAANTGNLKELVSFYTPDSQKRLSKIIEGPNEQEKKQLLAGWQKKPQICFVMDNGSLYTVFFLKKVYDTTYLFTQDVILEGGGMKLTNFRYNSFYTQLFQNKHFIAEFAKQILNGTEIKSALE